MPERPASTVQPSNPTSRRGAKVLSRATSNASRSKRRTRSSKRNRSKLASPAAINGALALAFGDATTLDASSPSARAAKSPAPVAAAAIDAHPVASEPPPRIRIGDAMRRSGLDEYKVARTFAGVVDKLSDGKTPKDTGGVQKLLVDVLKECSRHLDTPQSERAAPPAPAHITMFHLVPRPVRTQTPPQQQEQQQLESASSATQSGDPSDASQ